MDQRTDVSGAQRSFPCSQCGATVEYAPGTTVLKCPYCEAQTPIEAAGEVDEQDFLGALNRLDQDAVRESVRVVKCQACAAEVRVSRTTTSLSCVFCGTNIVAPVEEVGRIRPTGVLPFALSHDQAADAFRQWIRTRWFAPGALKNQSLIDERLTGVYLPAWTYDCEAITDYRGQRGDAYYVTVGTGSNRRTVRRIRWTSVAGRVRNRFDDVLVIASRSLEPEMVRKLEPWDLARVAPYTEEFLAGFRSECYQIDLRAGWAIAQDLMTPTIEGTIRNDIGGDEQRITWRHTTCRDVTFKYLLLPVWVSAYRYRGKVYRFLVNARTGEVQGGRPYSAWKIAGAIVAGVVLAGLVLLFLRR
jgi:DNA-directed RNA polymerase subunit RPC12/RpoP